MSRADDLIGLLQDGIVKRDARIAEIELEQRRFHDAQFNLKSLYKRAAIALSLDQDNTSWFEIVGDLEKVAALKEQQRGGVVLPEREEFDKWFRHEQLISESIDTTWISESFLPYRAWMARSRLNPLGECVAVPRELLDRALEGPMQSRMSAAEELRALVSALDQGGEP